MADTHTVLPKKLAQALMEASMQHFDAGGGVQPNQGNAVQYGTTTQGGGDTGNFNTDHSVIKPGDAGSSFQQGGYGGTGYYEMLANGIANAPNMLNAPQSSYQAQAPNIGIQNVGPRLANNQAAQQATYNNQYNLAQALLGQSQGQGPNPAQAQLAQNTANNVDTQGALMASQRGASANPALLARQAAMQGAATQQNSVGQAATLQAQQQLGAQQNLMQQQQNMQNAALQAESIGQGAQAAQNTAITQGQLGAQGINANTANQNTQARGAMGGGIMNAAGGIAAMLLSRGGEVQKMSDGGLMGIQHYDAPGAYNAPDKSADYNKASENITSGIKKFTSAFNKGGDVPGKSKMKGNSDKNDKVPALLSPGEIVLPRSVTMAPDMEKKAIEFLRHIKSDKKDYGSVMEARKQKLACGGKVY